MFLIVILLFTIVDYCSGGIEDFKKGLAAQPSPRSFFVVFKTWQTIEIVKILMIRCKIVKISAGLDSLVGVLQCHRCGCSPRMPSTSTTSLRFVLSKNNIFETDVAP